jgi:hypothetical protein
MLTALLAHLQSAHLSRIDAICTSAQTLEDF